MKTTSADWRDWWNERAKPGFSDLDVDRGGPHLAEGSEHTATVNEELERRARAQLLAALELKPTDLVLDAGCGTGANFDAVSPKVREVIGIDFSEEQIARAHRRIVSEKLLNVKAQVGDMTKLPFPADSFDKVICASVLQYLDDAECEAAVSEMIRVCRNDGIIVIHAKNRTSLYGIALSLLRAIARVIGRKTVNDHYRSRRWYGRVLSEYGGQIVDYDAFGIFHFPPLAQSIVQRLLRLELQIVKRRFWKRYGVNYKMTVRVNKRPYIVVREELKSY
jgi:ubiquinone/menaquinone biosynthesis C-methylase UbiE